MADTLEVEIVTPARAVYTGEATQIVVPGQIGELGILPGHLPLLTSIIAGDLQVQTTDGEERHFFIEGGFAEILPDKVSVLTADAQGVDELDLEEARRRLEVAEEEMKELEERARTEEVEADVQRAHHEALEKARRRLVFSEETEE